MKKNLIFCLLLLFSLIGLQDSQVAFSYQSVDSLSINIIDFIYVQEWDPQLQDIEKHVVIPTLAHFFEKSSTGPYKVSIRRVKQGKLENFTKQSAEKRSQLAPDYDITVWGHIRQINPNGDYILKLITFTNNQRYSQCYSYDEFEVRNGRAVSWNNKSLDKDFPESTISAFPTMMSLKLVNATNTEENFQETGEQLWGSDVMQILTPMFKKDCTEPVLSGSIELELENNQYLRFRLPIAMWNVLEEDIATGITHNYSLFQEKPQTRGSTFERHIDSTRKPRIAVMTFEDKTDRSFRWGGRTGKTSGEGLADMLTTALFNSGNYRVMEREQLNTVLSEQALSGSGLVSPESIVQAGELLGVDLMVFGSITEFGYSEKKTGIGRTGISTTKATLAVDIRLLDTTTGEIMAAEGVRKSESARGLSGIKLGGTDIDTESKFDNTLVGKAARKAIDRIVELADENRINITVRKVALDAFLATEGDGEVYKDGNTVILEAGAAQGLDVGDELLVKRDKGLSIAVFDTVARLKVLDNSLGSGQASICEVIEGNINELRSDDIVQMP